MANQSPKSAKKDTSATIGFEAKIWLTADKLRDNMNALHCVKDDLTLYGVKNAALAPGYRSPDQNKGQQ